MNFNVQNCLALAINLSSIYGTSHEFVVCHTWILKQVGPKLHTWPEKQSHSVAIIEHDIFIIDCQITAGHRALAAAVPESLGESHFVPVTGCPLLQEKKNSWLQSH